MKPNIPSRNTRSTDLFFLVFAAVQFIGLAWIAVTGYQITTKSQDLITMDLTNVFIWTLSSFGALYIVLLTAILLTALRRLRS